jgi:hypothetical protein
MHAARHPKPPIINRPPTTPAATFICSGCGAVQHTRTPVLPEGWWAIEVAEDIAVIFEDCPAPDAQDLIQ